jgi:hypothetical protein
LIEQAVAVPGRRSPRADKRIRSARLRWLEPLAFTGLSHPSAMPCALHRVAPSIREYALFRRARRRRRATCLGDTYVTIPDFARALLAPSSWILPARCSRATPPPTCRALASTYDPRSPGRHTLPTVPSPPSPAATAPADRNRAPRALPARPSLALSPLGSASSLTPSPPSPRLSTPFPPVEPPVASRCRAPPRTTQTTRAPPLVELCSRAHGHASPRVLQRLRSTRRAMRPACSAGRVPSRVWLRRRLSCATLLLGRPNAPRVVGQPGPL